VKDRGIVVAVEVHQNLWCYVRVYGLCHGFLPFFSKAPLTPERLPTLKAERYFDLWCYDNEPTPMQFVGHFPFENKEESYGEPYYTPPKSLSLYGLGDERYRIHEVRDGKYGMRITEDAAEVKGMRLQRRYEPHEFHQLLADVLEVWPIVDSAD